MAKVPRFLAPEPWENKDLYLYHGTLDLHVKSIRKGVNVERGALGRDFRPGLLYDHATDAGAILGLASRPGLQRLAPRFRSDGRLGRRQLPGEPGRSFEARLLGVRQG